MTRTKLKNKTLETFHFVTAFNVMMIVMIFVVIIFSIYAKNGIKLRFTNNSTPMENMDNEKIVLSIDNETMEMKGEKFQIFDLSKKMKNLKRADNPDVIICPASNVKINFVNDVNVLLRKSGINNITLQTSLAVF